MPVPMSIQVHDGLRTGDKWKESSVTWEAVQTQRVARYALACGGAGPAAGWTRAGRGTHTKLAASSCTAQKTTRHVRLLPQISAVSQASRGQPAA